MAGLTSSWRCWAVWNNLNSAISRLLARDRSKYVCTTEYERPQRVVLSHSPTTECGQKRTLMTVRSEPAASCLSVRHYP